MTRPCHSGPDPSPFAPKNPAALVSTYEILPVLLYFLRCLLSNPYFSWHDQFRNSIKSEIKSTFPGTLSSKLLLWMYDMLLKLASLEEPFDSIGLPFSFFPMLNVILHPDIYDLFTRKTRWCGRLITPEGVRYDSRRLESLLNMEPPETRAYNSVK